MKDKCDFEGQSDVANVRRNIYWSFLWLDSPSGLRSPRC